MSFACLVTPRGPQHLVGIVTRSVLHTLTNITIKGSKEFPELTARSWVRRLIDGLSPRSSGFSTRPVHLGSVVDEVALGQTFSPITSVIPCQQLQGSSIFIFSSSTKAIICIITHIIRIVANGATASRNAKEHAVIILERLKRTKNYDAVFTYKSYLHSC
jgi:hypothetical protein